MEEILVVLLSIVVELLVEVVAYIPWDAILWLVERRRSAPGEPFERPVGGVAMLGTVVGLALGGLSLLIRPQTALPYAWLRILNLLVAPTLSALLARAGAGRRSAKGQPSSSRHHFAFAFTLTLMLVVVRFAYGVRPK
jgi:hypothetical protein